MAPLPQPIPPTIRAIYAAYENDNKHYDSLGISVGEIGTECDRALWLNLRWASQPEHLDGRKIRLFDTGNREEERLVEDLQRIGVEVWGQQDRIRLVSGFVRGKRDGACQNVPEAPKTEHLLELKSTNAKGMKELQKHDPRKGGKGIRVSKPLHFGQCQIGMHGFSLTRALYLSACKDTDTLYAERIEYDAAYCIRQLARAERLVNSSAPPSRISDDPSFFGCMFCKHHDICHGKAWPRVTCRSCLHATPEMTGDAHWSCSRWAKPLSLDEQKAACPAHLYIPQMVPGEQTDADEENETVTYVLWNGKTWIDGKDKMGEAA